MILLGIIIITINILILVAGYYVIYGKIEKNILNHNVLKKIKEEVNSIIIKLNDTTINNISLIEEKKKALDKQIILSDKKIAGLKENISMFDKNGQGQLFEDPEIINKIYSPQKILKQSQKSTEKLKKEEKKDDLDVILADMTVIEKALFLFKKGWNEKEIQDKVGISSGELELITTMENVRDMAI